MWELPPAVARLYVKTFVILFLAMAAACAVGVRLGIAWAAHDFVNMVKP